ncbi:Set1 complex component ash2 [Sphaceloma murrayae]|uniref:Set1 complex component ash2 n=1 Tax=Sphaceloma murrayae TaxID=2082308 RepID=A0A2K1QR83_9PEZI|nr:Set1 complex component ash2 [Sphaceloma murrayae]
MTEESPSFALSALPPSQLVSQDHAPPIPSPLNPFPDPPLKSNKPKPPPRDREPRERKESQKKRESTFGGKEAASTVPAKRKASHINGTSVPSPVRYAIAPPPGDFAAPRPTTFSSHEPFPFLTPDGEIELKKPMDRAANARNYKYIECIADPLFSYKGYYRATDTTPYGPRMSFEDADKWIHFDEGGRFVTNEKGWRSARANVCVREGSAYFEVKVVRGVKQDEEGAGDGPQPRVRFGWARREAPLDSPVGYDGFGYGITDKRFETIYRSRGGKFWNERKGAKKAGKAEKEWIEDREDVREGDVIGLEINLPSLNLHRKVADGIYNPAVDLGDGFGNSPARVEPDEKPHDIIRDRTPINYKGRLFFELNDYYNEAPVMRAYNDRTLSLANLGSPVQIPGANTTIKSAPNANHPEPSLRTLPHSSIKVYRNGQLVGTAFDSLLAFLPPASIPNKAIGAREGFDDGMLGYFPMISCFSGGIAEVNFGEKGFWAPPMHLRPMGSSGTPGNALRPLGERFKEQIAEDVLYDIIDEVDFFMQDGGFGGRVGAGGMETKKGNVGLKEEVD